jgi:hypothetical protein
MGVKRQTKRSRIKRNGTYRERKGGGDGEKSRDNEKRISCIKSVVDPQWFQCESGSNHLRDNADQYPEIL